MKNILITGASSGIGRETAILFAKAGYKVIATARNIDRLKELESLGCFICSLDVTSEESIHSAFLLIYKQFKQIDILINNAGFSQNGFVEELTMEMLRYQFETNVFGLIRVTQMVLPQMRNNKSGVIINTGSVGGDFTSAGASAYHASKYALESFTDGMRQELKQFGIRVAIVKPGGVETNFVNNASAHYPQPIAGNPYKKMRENFNKMMLSILDSKNSSFPILKPIEVANAIYKAATISSSKPRIRVGKTAKLIPFIKSVISDAAFDNMIMKQLGLLK
jgi:NADP-dependent 3-hydroxy acid dehydrogenase YdfG